MSRKRNDNGLVVSGAKVVATASALTHQTFIAQAGLPLKDKRFAPIFIVDMAPRASGCQRRGR